MSAAADSYIPRTELEKIVIANPDAPWEWSTLSRNPNISLEMIMAHQELPLTS